MNNALEQLKELYTIVSKQLEEATENAKDCKIATTEILYAGERIMADFILNIIDCRINFLQALEDLDTGKKALENDATK